MKLNDLIKSVDCEKVVGNTDKEISAICQDSRQVAADALFVAVCGYSIDGHEYIQSAIEKGATAIVLQKMPDNLKDGVAYIKVKDSAEALGRLASAWYGNPSSKLKLVGVTGTNGKTTIATVLYKMYREFGHKVGLLSTVCNYVDERAVPATHTTPDPISLNKLLSEMVDAGCTYAFMEVSSHAADQKRIGGLKFVGGIFTNITRDHLDYHKTFDNYIKAKKSFFDSLPADAFALTNADDRNGGVMIQNSKALKKTYSIRSMADFRAKVVEDSFFGMLLNIDGREVSTQFVGRFNASNLLAVYSACVLLGNTPENTLVALSKMTPVNGRFETIRGVQSGVCAIVDYAHTPDALENVIATINEVKSENADLITVVGCGGNRDKGKRPIMAKSAVANSDKVVITSDNPRNEEPMDIINDMLAGLTDEEQRNVIVNADREQAIKTACSIAKKGDIILVAGKGHEDYQDIKGVKHHFDDHEVIRKYLI
ncbi:MAG: UDP-N-acetylmuramoyl-L-alanyl-D-glutamate--2,6-diaminopimelate ligase [Paludibacteraceae bacterium]|nr:UDP-N-acetylmuramoyl-L-alanyl-D-glutamate--2,6-diaminopimelate ligase [Paludibacteraceae bacterium]